MTNQISSSTLAKPKPAWKAALFSFEALLIAVLAIELVVFNYTAEKFSSAENAFEILRFSVEIGLLALVMTPVILTGGIDLSVGSLLCLCGVCLGKLWRDAGMNPGIAAFCTLAIGALAGGINALLITRLKLPPLIVTIGSFSLFRGLAEAITRGVDNYTGFPDGFLFLGQGYIFGFLPAQLPLLMVVAIAIWLLVHCTSFGRSFRAIGFSAEGARYAGIPVGRRITLVYVMSGFGAALASLVYVAHLGQAKADAGTGYELLAITAVVLGGTSIFGGFGSVHGTLLGLFVLAVLKRGLRMSDQPEELAGILTGALLLAVLTGEALLKLSSSRRSHPPVKSATVNQITSSA